MNLEQHLERYAGREVHVLLNSGNAGDGLIHLGGRMLFRKLGITVREFLYPADVRGETLLIHGCGAFGGVSTRRVYESRHYFDRFRELIILPSSFDTGRPEVREFLAGLPSHVTVYCREKISHALVLEVMAHPDNLQLDQDLALHCDFRRFASHRGKGTLVSFRTDTETAQEVLPATNIDVSRFGDKHDPWPLLYTVSRFAEVHTDRLHVGIVAAMTGRKTFLFDNSYHKIRAVYEHSLSNMEHVRYMEHGSPTATPSAASRIRMRLIHAVMRLRKPLVRAIFHLSRRRLRSANPPVVG